MMDLIPKKPFSELSTVRNEMDRLWNRFLDDWPLPTAFTRGWAPMADISETKDKLIVKAELPGLEPEDIKLSLSGNLLTIEGEKKKEKEEKDEHHYYMERYSGSFQRSFRLPVEVQENKIDAKFDKGVLTITMPKTTKSQKKEIKIAKAK
ncbi:Hsp20/alpha crystallin family protein [Thiovibrio frasassiensis]|uniref:Hsp20/alpha crystallin family protein n=1 Tax=Thiovibrio frasassiensis TaxID=2984131 RepID=A0A9X4MFA1_9BACT|nr:Hsp20/alpha crystallin family protein [Thiovibrio frasassiensis]MDG4476161.1 Hsp20/alpha crystallin family protein [Thiovibrio frasassiensis]